MYSRAYTEAFSMDSVYIIVGHLMEVGASASTDCIDSVAIHFGGVREVLVTHYFHSIKYDCLEGVEVVLMHYSYSTVFGFEVIHLSIPLG